MSIILFIAAVALLVLVHEFGHFLAAKFFGIKVEEFGIGFPPKIFGWQKGETYYSVNILPFGGFVRIFGEDGESGENGDAESRKSFVNAPRPKQTAILAAGVFFNLLFAWLLLFVGLSLGLPFSESITNYGKVSEPKLLITSVVENSPAAEAGLKIGDQILFAETRGLSLQGANIEAEKARNLILNSEGNEIEILYKRDMETRTAFLIPSYDIIPKKPAVGIMMDNVGTLKLPVLRSFAAAAGMAGELFIGTVSGFFGFLADALRGSADMGEIAGPIGIIGLFENASGLGFVYALYFTALISVNLAVINLIPFPALDGGRILFVLIESVKGSRINPSVAKILNIAGFAILLLIMVVVTFSDIYKIIN